MAPGRSAHLGGRSATSERSPAARGPSLPSAGGVCSGPVAVSDPSMSFLRKIRVKAVHSFNARPHTRWRARTGRAYFALRSVVRGYRGEKVPLRAAALTYISIFSLFPMISVALLLIQSLHRREFEDHLASFIRAVLSPGIRSESEAFFQRFLRSANTAKVGGVSFAMLLVSAGALLKNLESSLSEIWNARRSRPWLRRGLNYVLILLFGPVVVAVTLVGMAGLEAAVLGGGGHPSLFAVGTFALAAVGFSGVYLLGPNAHVRWQHAVFGGTFAALLWEAAKGLYGVFAAQIYRANPIYGSLGAAPLFLAWIYVSWLILFFGARLTYAFQYASSRTLSLVLEDHPRGGEWIAAQIAQQVTFAAVEGMDPPTPRELSESLRIPEHSVVDAVDRMLAAGLLGTIRRGGLFPAKSPDQLTLADLSSAVGGCTPAFRHEVFLSEEQEKMRPLEQGFTEADAASLASLARIRWSDLIAPLRAAARAPAPLPLAPERPLVRNP